MSEKDVLLGIHQVGDSISSCEIEDILANWLKITKHLWGATNNEKQLSNNVCRCI